MLEVYLFIAIIYTVGFVINKGLDIIYDHDTYVDHFSSFFLICIWLMVATSSWNIIYSSLFSIGIAGLFSFLFGLYQNKGKKKLLENNNDETLIINTNFDNIKHLKESNINKNIEEYNKALDQWIGKTGTILSYDEENDYYYGTFDDNRSAILKSEGEKLNKGDKFITTRINGVNIMCKKQD